MEGSGVLKGNNQVTIMLATSRNVLFPGHNHLLATSTDDSSLAHSHSGDSQSVRSSVPVVSRCMVMT